jgi:hypothetical protein
MFVRHSMIGVCFKNLYWLKRVDDRGMCIKRMLSPCTCRQWWVIKYMSTTTVHLESTDPYHCQKKTKARAYLYKRADLDFFKAVGLGYPQHLSMFYRQFKTANTPSSHHTLCTPIPPNSLSYLQAQYVTI